MAVLAGKRSWVLPSAVIVLAGLLGLLATLQYEWVGEITASERARMRAGAQARAEQLGREFDREITQAFVGLQARDDSTEGGGRAYAERYARWALRAPHPDLVQDVFLIARTPLRPATIARFDASAGRFEEEPWPAELAELQEKAGPPSTPRPQRFGPESEVVVGGIPVLIAPVMPSMPPDAPRVRLEPATRRDVLVIVLSSRAIRDEILPALARRHFAGENGELEYSIEVTSRRSPESVIFRSEADVRLARTDVTASLFALRFDELSDQDRRELATFRHPSDRRDAFRGRHAFRGLVSSPEAGYWRLVASRRGGSVDDVVAAARRRNLAVSFGILLLLGGSAGLVVAAASRSRRLAARQMEFVAGVSHELRTPVAVICSAGENLADGVVADARQVRRYGATIRDEGRRLAEMVEQVLEFAGTYASRRPLRLERLDPGRLVDEVLEAGGRWAEESGFIVEKRVDLALPTIYGDASAIRRALRNLLDNARKYGGPARWIGISVAAATLSGKRSGVRFSVEDRGPGIEPRERGRIFEPFYRGRAAHDGSAHGFGLGLSLVRSIVKAHGGAVEVSPGRDKGSVFSMVLPAEGRRGAEARVERSIDGIADSAR
jgi:signal transduction histidine kinase